MSRILYFDNYMPLLDIMKQNNYIKNLVELGHLRVDYDEGLEAQMIIFTLTDDYLEELNTK